MKRKNNYEQPETVVTRVELESPICSGSLNAEVDSPHGIDTPVQDVNTAFGDENNFGSTTDNPNSVWTEN